MAGEWRPRLLHELAEIFDGPHATPAKTNEGPIFLGISNLSQGRLDLTETEHLSEEDYSRWTKRVAPRAGDIVFSYETRLGQAARIPHGIRCCLGRRLGLLRAKTDKIDARFLLYVYLGPQFQATLREKTIPGSTVDRIPLIDMPNFPMAVPADIKEQQAIACILGALDDKIELNRTMSQTLEAMARAIFKSWFVNFDPVRAKAAGHEPQGLKPEIAALFPDGFEESELGEIPRGWKVTSLADEIVASRGLSYKGQYLCSPGEGLPMHNLNSVYEGGGYKHEGLKWYKGEYRKINLLNPGDVIVTNTEQGFDYLLIGYAAIVPEKYGNQSLFSQHIYRILPKETSYITPSFIYLLLRSKQFHDLVAGYSNGTTVNMLPLDGLQKPKFALPPEGLVNRFEKLFSPVHQRTEHVHEENETLAALRDALLPKLISGELRVKDAERIVGRCA